MCVVGLDQRSEVQNDFKLDFNDWTSHASWWHSNDVIYRNSETKNLKLSLSLKNFWSRVDNIELKLKYLWTKPTFVNNLPYKRSSHHFGTSRCLMQIHSLLVYFASTSPKAGEKKGERTYERFQISIMKLMKFNCSQQTLHFLHQDIHSFVRLLYLNPSRLSIHPLST